MTIEYIDSRNIKFKFEISYKRKEEFLIQTDLYCLYNGKWCIYDDCDFYFPTRIEKLSKKHPEAANYITKYIKNICFA